MSPARIDYWEKWGGKEREAMGGIVQAFNLSQDRYEVVMLDSGDWSSSPDLPRFLAAQVGGTPPDVIGLEDHQIVDLSTGGALMPLGSARESAAGCCMDLGAFRDEFAALGICCGNLYAVPISVDIVTLYVNLVAVQGTAFDGGRIPATLDEFDCALSQLEDKGKIGFVPAYPGWWPQAWAWFFGGSWVDHSGRFTPDRPENVRAFEWVRSLRERLDRSLGRRSRRFSGPVNPIGAAKPDPFLTGEVATVFEGDWLVRRLVATPGFEWVPAAFPSVDGIPSALIVGDLLAVPQGATNPDGALEFIGFATQPDRLESLALGQSKISPLREWSGSFLTRHSNPRIREFRDILASARLFHDPRVPGWLGYLGQVKEAFAAVWSGERRPAQALSAIRPGTVQVRPSCGPEP